MPVVENLNGVYYWTNEPMDPTLQRELFQARQWALDSLSSSSSSSSWQPHKEERVLTSEQAIQALDNVRDTVFIHEPDEKLRIEQDRSRGMTQTEIHQSTRKRWRTALFKRYGGELVARIIVAVGRMDENIIEHINQVSWKRHWKAGGVRTGRAPAPGTGKKRPSFFQDVLDAVTNTGSRPPPELARSREQDGSRECNMDRPQSTLQGWQGHPWYYQQWQRHQWQSNQWQGWHRWPTWNWGQPARPAPR